MNDVIIIKPNHLVTNGAEVMGFKSNKVGRFPGCTSSMEVFMFANGKFNHGVPKGKDRTKIQNELFAGEDLDSEHGKKVFKEKFIIMQATDEIINKDNAEDLLKYYILLAHLDMAVEGDALNIEATSGGIVPPQYIITTAGQDESKAFEKLSFIQKTNSKFQEIADKKKDYLIGLAKYIAPSSKGINTFEKAYIFLSGVLNGELDNDSKLKGCNRFTSLLEISPETIVISADVKEAIFKQIIYRENGKFINGKTGNFLGQTEEQVVNYFLKDQNQDELGLGKTSDQDFSIRKQLAFKRAK